MRALKKFFDAVADWIFVGKRLPILIVAAILIIASVTVTVAVTSNKKEEERVTVYLTVSGLGEGLDCENRVLKIKNDDTVKQIFSKAEYPEYYEQFGTVLVHKNEFKKFMGVEAKDGKAFHVTVGGIHDNNLDQAFVSEGQTIEIRYY